MAMSAGDTTELLTLLELRRCFQYQQENLRHAQELSGKLRGFRTKPNMGRLVRMQTQAIEMEHRVSERINAVTAPDTVVME